LMAVVSVGCKWLAAAIEDYTENNQ